MTKEQTCNQTNIRMTNGQAYKWTNIQKDKSNNHKHATHIPTDIRQTNKKDS